MYNNVIVRKSDKLKPDEKVVLPFRMPPAKPIKFRFGLPNTFSKIF